MAEAIRDSGKRQTFSTGAVRDVSAQKGRFDLLPPTALRRLAAWFGAGAEKYAARNWEKGLPLSNYVNSAWRHMVAWLAGLRDEDHGAAWIWNAVCAIETEARIRAGILPAELHDIPLPLSPEDAAKWRKMIEEVFEPIVPVEQPASEEEVLGWTACGEDGKKRGCHDFREEWGKK